jgi:Fe-Mn family superoxide dismutase
MKTEVKPLSFKSLSGISDKTMMIHHDKLYAGYVAKKNEVQEKLKAIVQAGGDLSSANQTYSELRALMDGGSFAVNGVYLHEWYFDTLGGDGKPSGALAEDLAKKYGSFENFFNFFSAAGMAARGWVVLCWDTHDQELRIYIGDMHNQGGIWGCLPILVLDVYEHAYFIDYGSDRKAYIADWWKNVNWAKANELYEAAK